MKTETIITSRVINLSEIPEDLTKDLKFIKKLPKNKGIFVEVHVDESEEGELEWFEENYPELIDETSFLIQIDI